MNNISFESPKHKLSKIVKQIFLRCLEAEICSKMLGKSDFGNPKNHVKSLGENEGFRTEGISPIHRDFLQT